MYSVNQLISLCPDIPAVALSPQLGQDPDTVHLVPADGHVHGVTTIDGLLTADVDPLYLAQPPHDILMPLREGLKKKWNFLNIF